MINGSFIETDIFSEPRNLAKCETLYDTVGLISVGFGLFGPPFSS